MAQLSMHVYVAYNEDGDFAADSDEEAAVERLTEEYGGTFVQLVQIRVNAPAPVTHDAGTVSAKTPVSIATADEEA